MSKKILICALFIFNTVLANEESIFTTLKNWYQDGEKISFDSIEGVHAGRCYDKLYQNIPKNSVIVAQVSMGIFDHGPAFDNEEKKFQVNRLIEFGFKDKESNHLDNIKPGQIKLILTPKLWKNVEPVKIIDGDITTVEIASDSIISVRDYNNYKILIYKARKNQKLLIRENKVTIDVKENETYMVCYYFKTIL